MHRKSASSSGLAAACMVAAGMALVQSAWSMDFRQAYDAAYDNDASIRAARAGAQASRERLPQAHAQLLPNVTLSAGRSYNDLTSEGRNSLGQPSRTEANYYSGNQTLAIRQSLYRPFQRAQVRQAEAQVEDANAALERDEQSLVVRVGEAGGKQLPVDSVGALSHAERRWRLGVAAPVAPGSGPIELAAVLAGLGAPVVPELRGDVLRVQAEG